MVAAWRSVAPIRDGLLLGVLYLLYLYVRHSERVANTGRIFVDEPHGAVEAPGATIAPTT